MREGIDLKLKEADILYYPNFCTEEESEFLFKTLLHEIKWQQDDIKVYGKVYKQPRLTALYANNNKPYRYSNLIMTPNTFTSALLELKEKVEKNIDESFTSCLLNLYRNGSDSNGWHADNEKELGNNPVIASVSLGSERIFHLKHRHEKGLKHKLILEKGSLLVMKGSTQHNWLHQIPKTKKEIGKRINLTFRSIK